jgi:hypothetical protein
LYPKDCPVLHEELDILDMEIHSDVQAMPESSCLG